MEECLSNMVFKRATCGDGGDGGGDDGDGGGDDGDGGSNAGDGGGDHIQTCLRRHKYILIHISLGIAVGS